MKFVQHSEINADTVDGYAQPLFFTAKLEDGIVRLPWEKYRELYRLEGVHVK